MIEGACSLLRDLSRKVTAGCSRDRGAHSLSPSSAHAPEASPPVLQLLPICRTPLPHPGCQQAGGVSQGPAGQGCPQMMGKMGEGLERQRNSRGPQPFLASLDPKADMPRAPASRICRQNPGPALLWAHQPCPSVLGTLPAKVRSVLPQNPSEGGRK